MSTGSAAATGSVPGSEMGKYRLIASLARGGMGNVYLGVSQGPGGFHKLVAVKELRPEFARDETYVSMFVEEARLAARLAHPNIVQTNEVGSAGSRHFMIMEYLDGRSLYRVAKQLGRQGLFPVGAHLRVISEALLGLHHAHDLRAFDGEALGIVHRDMSPLNVFVTFEGQAKVLDFGVAKAVDSPLETQAGILKGRIAYMAPEQARGGRVDRRADVYATGVMIWEAAAGRRLWPGMSDVEILTRALGEGPPRLRAVDPTAPADLDALCARAMAQDPNERYPSAQALVAELDDHLARRRDAMSMREIGGVLSAAFEPERRQMNALIDEALAHTRGTPRSGVMPARPTRPERSEIDPAAAAPLLDDLVSLPSLLVGTPSSRPAREPPARPSSAMLVAGLPLPDDERRQALRRSRVVTAACAVAATAIVFAVFGRAPAIPATAPAPVPAAAPAAVAPVEMTAPPPAPPAPAATVRTVDRPSAPVMVTAPRWVAPPSHPPPQAQARPARYGGTDTGRSPTTTLDAPVTPGPSQRGDLDPGGGRLPQRPIVTANPYGAQ